MKRKQGKGNNPVHSVSKKRRSFLALLLAAGDAKCSALMALPNFDRMHKTLKTDENNARLFSKLEEQVALSILKGMPVSKCAQLHGLSKLKCQTIVNTYCFKSNRRLYDTLRKNHFEVIAPISKLRKNAQVFIDGAERNKKITLSSSIMALPDVPVRALNALWYVDITTIEELLRCTERDLKRLRNAGKISCDKLITALKTHGFHIGT